MRSLAVLAFVALTACSRSGPPTSERHDTGPIRDAAVAALASGPTAASAPTPAVTAAPAAPPAPVAPRGSATLIVQRVDTQCYIDGKIHESFLGHDVLLDLVGEDGKKLPKDYALCPRVLPDGGAVKVSLNTWEMCRSFPTCKIVSPDAGDGASSIQCGKDSVSLEVKDGRTILRGPSGEREVAPFPMKLTPPKRTVRKAFVDC